MQVTHITVQDKWWSLTTYQPAINVGHLLALTAQCITSWQCCKNLKSNLPATSSRYVKRCIVTAVALYCQQLHLFGTTLYQQFAVPSEHAMLQKSFPLPIPGNIYTVSKIFLISQGSVATCLRWDVYCCMDFTANFIRFPVVQKFRKSVKIWQSRV